MKGRWTPLLVSLLLSACATNDLALGLRYLDDRAFRRSELERSVVNPDNGYAQLRYESYALDEEGWETLEVFNPPVRPLVADDIGDFIDDPLRHSTAEEGALHPVFVERPRSEEEWVELGRSAFETYPVQLTDLLGTATSDRDTLDRYGLWVDGRGHVGGLVRARTADGTERFAMTCATCHSRPAESGELVHGVTNHRFDWGSLSYRRLAEAGAPDEAIGHLAEWGPGQVDVTSDGVHNATAITDLRGVRHHAYLHWAATLENNLIALTIRLETLMITSMSQSVRPPREVAFAIAMYLYAMADLGNPGDRDAEPAGAALFDEHCAGCHGADGTVAQGRTAIATVGTDPLVGASPERRTGFYRVPSLWGAADRGQLLHDGDVDSIEHLLDPIRLETIAGHEYGTRLSEPERAALAAFVRTIGAR